MGPQVGIAGYGSRGPPAPPPPPVTERTSGNKEQEGKNQKNFFNPPPGLFRSSLCPGHNSPQARIVRCPAEFTVVNEKNQGKIGIKVPGLA